MSNFETLRKDLGATARRIINNVKVFTDLSTTDQVKLHEKLTNWTPKTAESIYQKGQAIEVINTTENFLVEPELEAVPLLVTDEEVDPAMEALIEALDESMETHPPVIEPATMEIPTASSGVSSTVAEKIARETFVFEFHFSQPTFIKKVESIGFFSRHIPEPTAEATRFRVSKYTIEREGLKKVYKHGGEFTRYLRDISLPKGYLTPGPGQHLIPLARLEDLKRTLTEFLEEREVLLDQFAIEYPSLIEDAKEKLGPEFNSGDYPSTEEMRSSFTTSFKYISNTVPEELARVSKEIYEAEQGRVIAMCQAEGGKIQAFLRENFAGLVDHFADILGNDEETGKVKQFQKGTVENLKEFVATFKQVNLTDDGDLATLVAQTEALLDGVDPKKIRTDEEFRQGLNASFAALKESAAKLVVTRVRKIEL